MIPMLFPVFLSAIHFAITTTGASIDLVAKQSANERIPANQTTLSLPSSAPSSNDISTQCTSSSAWTGNLQPWEFLTDCRAAFRVLDEVEMSHMTPEYEFLASTAENKTDLPIMRTPRRYTQGKPEQTLPLQVLSRCSSQIQADVP